MNCRFNNSGFCLLAPGKRCQQEGCTRLEHGERVHVYSWPIARAFTFSEWCDYLDSHKEDSSAAIAEFGGWKFNVHGACLNRKIAVKEYIGRTGAKFQIDVYQTPKGRILGAPLVWNYATSYSVPNGGGTAGCGEVDGDEEDAVIEGLKKVSQTFSRDAEWYRKAGRTSDEMACKEAGNKAQEEIYKFRELTLF